MSLEGLFYSLQWQDNFDTHPCASDAPLECVIVEPRNHDNLDATLRNISCMLPYAALTVYHSKQNASNIRNIVYKNGETNNVNLRCFTEDNITRFKYCDMLCDPTFWGELQSDKVLIFQTDSGIRKNTLLRYMEYDYIGAPWSWPIYGDPNITIGNGGFSLRSRRLMHDICQVFKRNLQCHDKDLGEPEDVFFARHLIHVNDAILPTFEIASSFAVEHNTHADPFAFHQAYAFHPKPIVERWFNESSMDPYNASVTLCIKDAWIETDFGHVWSSPKLTQWLALGIGSAGFRLPKDSRIDCVSSDVHFGLRKWLCVILQNIKTKTCTNVKVPLYQNRCKEDIHVTP
jgi:hypothetical protein